MSVAYLILCHNVPQHILMLAKRHLWAQYYIHLDAKVPLSRMNIFKAQPNIHLIRHQISVNWGGFSMIEATLALMQAALGHKENRYFHLMSGTCVPLLSAEQFVQQCAEHSDKALWLESRVAAHLRYRTRFYAPHADTKWQRHVLGKCLTQGLKWADKLLPSDEICLTGSQWFSANRDALAALFDLALSETAAHFEKRLVPDEHIWQYIVAQYPHLFEHINQSKRFIRMQQGNNHPEMLTLDHLWQARRDGYWFARKVNSNTMARFLDYEKQI